MAFRLRHSAGRLGLAAALAASIAWILLAQWLWTPTGLTRAIHLEPGFTGPVAHLDLVRDVDLDFTAWPHGPRRWFSARWSGVWHVERAGAYDLSLGADDRAALRVDGEVVLLRNAGVGYSTITATRELTAGDHTIEVDYEQGAGRWFLNTQWAPHGETPSPLAAMAGLFPTAPTPRQVRLNAFLRLASSIVVALWLLAGGLLLWPIAGRVRRAVREDPAGWRGAIARWRAQGWAGSRPSGPHLAGPHLAGLDTAGPHLAGAHSAAGDAAGPHPVGLRPAWVRSAGWRFAGLGLARGAAVLIVVIAAALRFEAIAIMYGPFEHPAWLFELEAHTRGRIESLRPAELHLGPVERPYAGGDPINYLRFARAMTSFYAAHVREPMFPFATKRWLALLEDQDVAVSFASATFSTLAVLATYLLGSYAFSRWVGLGAALAFAIERDTIKWAAEGWRDDAMTCVFVASCYACLRCRRSPTVANAIAAGAIGGLACLTRITALSFLLPAVACVAMGGGRQPLFGKHPRAAMIMLAVLTAVTAPYLINCAIVFGDPLYAINYHTVFYRARAGLPSDQPMGVGTYLGTELQRDPWRVVVTFVEGLTTYPFSVKWIGFDYWWNGLGGILRVFAVAGLVGFLASSTGRVLLVLLASSLLPYAFTWNIRGGGEWRFTMHAYPIYLIAAALAVERTIAALWRLRKSIPPHAPALPGGSDAGALGHAPPAETRVGE